MAMQKLYQTFVAQAAQLQSVHENVKVSSLPVDFVKNVVKYSCCLFFIKTKQFVDNN